MERGREGDKEEERRMRGEGEGGVRERGGKGEGGKVNGGKRKMVLP